jgi:histidyl-tRNA synthetase
MPSIPAVRGTHDILPTQSHEWDWLLAAHADAAERFGYRRADTPTFEHTELFERGVGAGTDVVDKEMFTFADKGGRSLTLRPEGTAGMTRAILDSGLTQQLRPVRVHYAGPEFRYDAPQAGRFRQFHQVGVECIGERSPHLDVEVIEVGMRFLERLGVTGLSLQVNTLGTSEERARFRAALIGYYDPLRDQLCDDCRRRLDVNPLRLLDCKKDSALAEAAPRLADMLTAESAAYFDDVLGGLDAAGIAYTRNHRLVRGLDYYADTTFEIWHTSLQGAQNALGGGGRYDGLAEELGFKPAPGVGYAMGIERILLVAEKLGVAPAAPAVAEAVVTPFTAAEALAAAAAARTLREAGVRTVLDTTDRKIGTRISAAAKLGARVLVLLGSDEVAAGEATVRDLALHSQERIPTVDLVDRVRRALAAPAELPA